MPDAQTLGPEHIGEWMRRPDGPMGFARLEAIARDGESMMYAFRTPRGLIVEHVWGAALDHVPATASQLRSAAKRELWWLLNPWPALRAGALAAMATLMVVGLFTLVSLRGAYGELAALSAVELVSYGNVGLTFTAFAAVMFACGGALANLADVLTRYVQLARAARTVADEEQP